MSRVARRFAAVVTALTALVTVTAPSAASAHAMLVYSVPAASSVLASPPDRVELAFSEDIEATLSDIRLFDSAQKEITIGKTRSGSKKNVVTADIPTLQNGTYVVVWRVTSSDGHPVNGAFPFEIGTVSTGNGPALVDKVAVAVQQKSPLGGVMSAAKFLAFVGFVLLLGVLVFTWGTQFLGSVRALGSATLGLVLLLLGSLGVLFIQGPYGTGGGWSDIARITLVQDVITTRVGLSILARVVLALLWLFLVQILRRQEWNSVTGTLVVVLGVLTSLTFPLAGHPVAASLPGIYVVVDMVHVLAVGAWIGGLFVMVLLRGELHGDAAAGSVRRFSRIATWALPLVVVTGAAQGLHLIGGPGAVGDTDYSWILVAKAALVCLVVLLGLRARRTLATDSSATPRFDAVIRLESIVAVVVLGLSAVLVNSSPVPAVPPVESFSARLVQRSIIAEVTVTPPKVGTSEIHLLFTPPGGSLAPVSNVKVRMTLQASEVPPIPVDTVQVGANHWSGVVQIPYPGNWSLEILVSPQPNTELRYATTVPVKE